MGAALWLLFGANLLAMGWAAVSGTWLAARLLDQARASRPAPWPARLLVWTAILAVLGWSGFVFGNLGAALHRKTQILKCHYSADWSSFRLELPELNLRSAMGSLLSGTVPVGARLTVRVQNPTELEVSLERSTLELRHQRTLVARTRLEPLRLPAGATVERQLELRLELQPAALLKGKALLSRAGA